MFTITCRDQNFLPHLACEINFTIPRGETSFITGENGLGKSTLMSRVHESIPESYLISQNPLDAFYDRKLSQYKETVLRGFSEKIDRELFLFNWKAFGLELKMDRMLSQLSGGERQSVKLATGLSLNYPLLILDEPSQYLDKERKKILFDQIRDLNSRDKTFLIVEHDLSWWKDQSRVIPLKAESGVLKEGDPWTIS